MKVFNLHHRKTWNVGDLNCGPAQYFRTAGIAQDVHDEVDRHSAVILGGGGLLHEFFTERMETLRQVRKLVVWGVGTNTHGKASLDYPEWLAKCALVGVRDVGTPYRWVPCPSCMHESFGYMRQPTHRVVQYIHAAIKPVLPLSVPTMANSAGSVAAALDFLASGEFVVTNTYHGAYWATLLGRRVIMYPFSSRHFHMKHPPVLATTQDKPDDLMARAQIYPNALEECRQANISFEADVRRVLAA